MKMNYLHNPNRVKHTRARRTTIIVAVLIAAAVLLIARRPITNFVYTVTMPLWPTHSYLEDAGGRMTEVMRSKLSLIEENEELQQEVARLRIRNAVSAMYIRENTELKAMLGRGGERPEGVVAAVMSRPPATPYDVMLLDAGSEHGVSAGDMVVADGYVLGSVVEAYPRRAKAQLFSAPGNELQVRIGGEVTATAKGRGGGDFQVTLPRGVDVAEGDVVHRPSIDPRAYGVVEKITQHDADSYQTLLFKQPVNILDIGYVRVVPERERMEERATSTEAQ